MFKEFLYFFFVLDYLVAGYSFNLESAEIS